MKNHLLLLLLLMPAMMVGQTVGHVSVNVAAGVSLTEVQGIYFSNILVTGLGSVTILVDNSRTWTGDVVLKDEYASSGKFQVVGSPNANFKVSFSDAVTVTNGKYILAVSDLKTSLPNNIGTTNADGKLLFNVGCKILFPANINSGLYSGQFTITAQYE